ncbi:hypothetical protein BH09BAC1_BH09BAC1_08280 [soil metagenome]
MEKQIKRRRKTMDVSTLLPKVRTDIVTGQIHNLEEVRSRINEKLHAVNWRMRLSA